MALRVPFRQWFTDAKCWIGCTDHKKAAHKITHGAKRSEAGYIVLGTSSFIVANYSLFVFLNLLFWASLWRLQQFSLLALNCVELPIYIQLPVIPKFHSVSLRSAVFELEAILRHVHRMTDPKITLNSKKAKGTSYTYYNYP